MKKGKKKEEKPEKQGSSGISFDEVIKGFLQVKPTKKPQKKPKAGK